MDNPLHMPTDKRTTSIVVTECSSTYFAPDCNTSDHCLSRCTTSSLQQSRTYMYTKQANTHAYSHTITLTSKQCISQNKVYDWLLWNAGNGRDTLTVRGQDKHVHQWMDGSEEEPCRWWWTAYHSESVQERNLRRKIPSSSGHLNVCTR